MGVAGLGALAIGVDVGGTGVKAAIVRRSDGALVSGVVRLPTPNPALVEDVVAVVADVVHVLDADVEGAALSLGVALSGDVRDGRHTSGVNLHDSWVGAPARDLLAAAIGRDVRILNDADAAGLGEAAFGAAGVEGLAIVLTFGTGIGSGILFGGRLLPNTGLGQLPFHGVPAEQLISAVARDQRGLSWDRWASDVSDYLAIVDELLRPDLLVIGGGVIAAREAFWGRLRPPCRMVPATLGNAAGIVGAALFATDGHRPGISG